MFDNENAARALFIEYLGRAQDEEEDIVELKKEFGDKIGFIVTQAKQSFACDILMKLCDWDYSTISRQLMKCKIAKVSDVNTNLSNAELVKLLYPALAFAFKDEPNGIYNVAKFMNNRAKETEIPLSNLPFTE